MQDGEETRRRTVKIVCVGNEIVCDDGVGIRLGRILLSMRLPDHVRVELRRAVGLELLDELDPGEDLVVVDASHTGVPPGTCTVLGLADLARISERPYCAHAVGLAEVLELAARVCPERVPDRMDVVGVEAEVLDRFGTTLSASVEAAVPRALEVVLGLARVDGETLGRARQAAREWEGFSPEPQDLLS